MTPTQPLSDEEQFRHFFADTCGDLSRFVARRVHPSHVEDVVAEVFLVAWRRFGDLPTDPGDRRAFLFGIARGTLLNAARGARRQQSLALRLGALHDTQGESRDDAIEPILDRVVIVGAWNRLTSIHQETLALVYWDDLTSVEAARVLGISPVAFRLRLTRARRALRAAIGSTEATSTPRPALRPERSTP